MTELRIMPQDGSSVLACTRDPQDIGERLAAVGVRYERFAARRRFGADTEPPAVIDAYRDVVQPLVDEYGYRRVDAVRLVPRADDPLWLEQVRQAGETFRAEHWHAEEEIRLVVEGRCCFYLHIGDRVHVLVCEAGDLVSVPQGVRHWFDMGAVPELCVIRLFRDEHGWRGAFTGEPLPDRFPRLDELGVQNAH
ncbi:cupin domain-containing protein [Nonomuraea lactucae]|uniref:cupin domain-containing protein n=1 Tax=Nonomuraea lactucae TaxID=2249762 RepID=UPI000DE26113|nr:cupin domain-containing protein [Nonomuraea lactucae]